MKLIAGVVAAVCAAGLFGCGSHGPPVAAVRHMPAAASSSASASPVSTACPAGTVPNTLLAGCITKAQARKQLAQQHAQQLAAAHAAKAQARRRAAAKARQAAARARAARIANSVEYVVTGSPAMVTYGPAGTDLQGSSPMAVTARLANPAYYAITAQLQGGGSVTCKLIIGGQVVSTASASGSYNIATCEAVSDGMGGWQDANTG